MPVQNIECQIAQAQLGRYLAGESFSPEMLVQLEGHLSKCPECKADAAKRREELRARRPEPETSEAPAKAAPKARRMALVDLARERSDAAKPNPSLAKPLLYGGALAVVLIGMSYLARDPSALLGQKALPAAKAAPVAQAPASTPANLRPLGPVGVSAPTPFVDPRKREPTVSLPVPRRRTAETAAPAPPVASEPTSVAPVVPPAPAAADPRPVPTPPAKAKPKPAPVAKAAASPRRTLRRAPKRPPQSGIRVYDSNGVPRRP